MPVTVKVNGVANSLIHKGSNAVSIATIPDVCKTPSPAGPVPIPYPNISQSATLDKGSTTVKADGGMMIAIKGSEFSLSNGDEPGTVGGVKSNTFIKESTWILYSFDVRIEGKNACRLSDKKFQNHENTVDLAGALTTPTPIAADIPGPPGDCNAMQYERLNGNVAKGKEAVAAAGGACDPDDSPSVLQAKGEAWQQQADARAERDSKCFRGGDAGHRHQQAVARDHAQRCQYIRQHGKPPRWPHPVM